MSLVDGAAVGCDINEFITPLDFRLSPKQETNEMSALTQELAAHGPTSSPLLDTFAAAAASPPTLSAGSVVVALWSEGWYRAALLRDVAEPKPETVVDVRFIDYGNCDQVLSAESTFDTFMHSFITREYLLRLRLHSRPSPGCAQRRPTDSSESIEDSHSVTALSTLRRMHSRWRERLGSGNSSLVAG